MKAPDGRQQMKAGSGSASPAGERTLTIGQVVRLLKEDYPDLSISKLRYLENRGLVTPARTPGGYRKYGAADVRHLRAVLSLQRDEYLPLDVILERLDRGMAQLPGRSLCRAVALEGAGALRRTESRVSYEETLAVTGVEESFLRQLAEFHLIEKVTGTGTDSSFRESDVEIILICDKLARYGLGPRNLRLLRSSVEREAALVEQVVAPVLRSAHRERREEGEKLLQHLGALLSQLIDVLLYRELRGLVE